ncbi:MAG TPA: radical SAM protein [Armatimonadota bacterium]|nr:radical SAM protein [Armatimonadota bacterium]
MSELCGFDRSASMDDLLISIQDRDPGIPLAATAEVTYRCNFGCPHCFCRLPEGGPTPMPELTLQQWDRILGEAADEGVLFLTITGGEPLVREDFPDLWRMAKRRGFIVELFTNASLIDAATADLLAEYTAKQVSVTVYAATEETYRLMTGRPGTYAQVLGALELMVERGIHAELKGLLTRLNAHEFEAIRAQALRHDDVMRWQGDLVRCYTHGGGDPGAVALSPEEFVALELADPVRSGEWRERLANWTPAPGSKHSPFRCALGKGRFHLDPYGRMHPCMLLESVSVDCRTMSVHRAWREELPKALAAMPWEPSACNVCEVAELCHGCPAKFLLAGLPAGGPDHALCELARVRARAYGILALPASEGRV